MSHTVIGVVSDTHLGSAHAALSELQAVYDEFAFRGVQMVLHAGDVFAGGGMYRNQTADAIAPIDQVCFAEEHYPKAPGVRTHMISGNHDLHGAFGDAKRNPVQELSRRRRDVVYLGDERATVVLDDGTRVLLAHGSGPTTYAHSYKAQRFIEQISPERMPDLLVLGHFHKAGFFRHAGVTCLMAGCFQHETEYLRRNLVTPDVGGWILMIRRTSDGTKTTSAEWIGRPVETVAA